MKLLSSLLWPTDKVLQLFVFFNVTSRKLIMYSQLALLDLFLQNVHFLIINYCRFRMNNFRAPVKMLLKLPNTFLNLIIYKVQMYCFDHRWSLYCPLPASEKTKYSFSKMQFKLKKKNFKILHLLSEKEPVFISRGIC